MNENVKTAHDAWQAAEKDLHAIQSEYNEKLQQLKDRYRNRLEKAGEKAHQSQKAYCDLEAVEGIRGRDDIDEDSKRALAEGLNLAW